MITRQFQFFKGVGIAARWVLADATPVSLDSDASLLASVSLCQPHTRNFQDFYHEDDTLLAATWITARLTAPHVRVQMEPSQQSSLADRSRFPQIALLRKANMVTYQSLGDDSFGRLLDGAQTGLTLLQPAVTSRELLEDAQIIGRALPGIRAMYERNGVPGEVIPELLTYEYANYRFSNPSASLAAFLPGLLTGGRYGSIVVNSTPSPADVFIDSQLTGKSTVSLATPAGPHLVAGQLGALKDTRYVTVPASGCIVVDLALT